MKNLEFDKEALKNFNLEQDSLANPPTLTGNAHVESKVTLAKSVESIQPKISFSENAAIASSANPNDLSPSVKQVHSILPKIVESTEQLPEQLDITLPQASEEPTSSSKPIASRPWSERFCSWSDKTSKALHKITNLVFAYHLFDRGLANFLNLDTLRHGTNIVSYMGISLRGANPQMGGSMEAIVHGRPDLAKLAGKYFYLVPDPALHEFELTNLRYLGFAITPSAFIQKATAHLFGLKVHGSSISPVIQTTKDAIKAITAHWIASISPVVRFRFKPEELLKLGSDCRFEVDPHMQSEPIRTSHSISPLRLGICGSLTQGIGSGMVKRMQKNPIKVISGIAFMALATYNIWGLYIDWKGDPKKPPEETVQSAINPSDPWIFRKLASYSFYQKIPKVVQSYMKNRYAQEKMQFVLKLAQIL